MNNPMMMLANMMKSGNSQQMISQIMNMNSNNNPMINNALEMAQRGDTQGIEQLARNIAKERGINVEQGIQSVRSMLGM